MARPKKLAPVVPAESPVVDEVAQPEPPKARREISIDSEGVSVIKPEPGSKAMRMLEALAVQPMVRFVLPLDGGEKPGRVWHHKIINGLTIRVLKGVPVSLPAQIVAELEESRQITKRVESENDSLLDGGKEQGKFLGKIN